MAVRTQARVRVEHNRLASDVAVQNDFVRKVSYVILLAKAYICIY